MAESSIAKAYVQIIPSAKGIKGELAEQFDGEGQSVANSLMSKIKSTLISAGIGTAIAATFKTAISEGSKLEQSLGGVETLFKNSAGTVKAFAERAYKTAGLSAREYMENVTSFSASLIGSCGNDTAKAAEIANRALIDMSDNANKMGTSMVDIQNAYQGFAKQNYTMLDNLKLGYGGTQEEMKRLIHDASQMTDAQDKLNVKVKDGDMSFANVANAISVMQENLGIAGTTAEEASKTFSGSFNQMRAAAQNLLGYMANGMDVGPALQELVNSAGTFFFGNFLPMLGRVALAIPRALTSGFNTLAEKLRSAGTAGIGSFLSGLLSQMPALVAAAGNLIAALVEYVASHAGDFVEMAHQCVVAFVEGLSEVIPMSEETIARLPGVIEGALKGMAAIKAFSVLTGPVNGLIGAVQKLGPAFGGVRSNVMTFFGLMKSGGGVMNNLALMASQGDGALAGLATSFVSAGGGAKGLLAVLKVAGSGLMSTLFSPVTLIAGAVLGLAAGFVHLWKTNEEFGTKMTAVWDGLVTSFKGFVQGIMDRINEFGFDFQSMGEFLGAVWDGFCSLLAPVFESAWTMISGILSAAMDIITGLLDIFIGLFTGDWEQFWSGIKEVASGIWDGICSLWSGFWESLFGISDAFLGLFGTSWSELWTNLKQGASDAWNEITSVLSGIWNGLIGTASAAWNGIKTAITTTISTVQGAVSNVFNSVKSVCISIWNGLKNTASSVWNGIKTAIMAPVTAAKDAVSRAVATMKSVFNNCSLKLPHIPLPHFSITGKFSLMPPSIPHFSVSWYAKGGILDGATIFGAKGNRLLGGGEAGPEAVLPLADFYSHLDKSLESAGASDDALDRVIALLTIIADKAEKEIYMDRKMVGKLISEDIQSSIEERKWMRAKVVGGTV